MHAVEVQDKEKNSIVNHPVISDETMKEMAKFFMKTSIPRILREERKESRKEVAQ